MQRWLSRTLLALVLLPIAVVAVDHLVWATRGYPTQHMDVNVFTVMELKGSKEDLGQPDTQTQTCAVRLISDTSIPTCLWLRRHLEIIHRY